VWTAQRERGQHQQGAERPGQDPPDRGLHGDGGVPSFGRQAVGPRESGDRPRGGAGVGQRTIEFGRSGGREDRGAQRLARRPFAFAIPPAQTGQRRQRQAAQGRDERDQRHVPVAQEEHEPRGQQNAVRRGELRQPLRAERGDRVDVAEENGFQRPGPRLGQRAERQISERRRGGGAQVAAHEHRRRTRGNPRENRKP